MILKGLPDLVGILGLGAFASGVLPSAGEVGWQVLLVGVWCALCWWLGGLLAGVRRWT